MTFILLRMVFPIRYNVDEHTGRYTIERTDLEEPVVGSDTY
jgi:hypothetical protein